MVSRRGLGIGLILVGAGAAVGVALLLQPVQGGTPSNLCANVVCQAGYLCDPNTGKCVPQNPGATSYTLTIGATDTSGTPVSGLSATIDASTSNAKAITIPSSQVLTPGAHTISIPQSQTLAAQVYTFDHWGDLSAPNNVNYNRAITLTADLTIQAVFKLLVPLTVYTYAQLSSGLGNLAFAVQIMVDGVPYQSGIINLSPGSHTVTVPTTVSFEGQTFRFSAWGDGSTNPSRTISISAATTLTVFYCCYNIGTSPVLQSVAPLAAQPTNYYDTINTLLRGRMLYG